ncbi:PP2C family protein-serine/threonine phosphatase [Methanocaldococcus indicus]|uniref:PP2C family protein-serine/threonine phosphatase n=1 Tax=Methanocaldococcus indicus TaxID=213231 RepID=UPI003C6D9BFA
MGIINKFFKKVDSNKEKENNIELTNNRDIIIFEEDKAYGISHKGNRTNNEDAILIKKLEDAYLLAVADGLGGHNAGEVASSIAIDTLQKVVGEKYNKNLSIEEIKELLKEAYETAHKQIKAEAIGDKEGMGTTLTSVIIKGNKAIVANCGDSRAYLIRDNKIIERTKDHTYVQMLVDEGHITEEEAMYHPMKNIITFALGIDDFKVDIYEWNLKDDDIILLSSDGLHDYVKKEEILDVIKNYKNPKDIVDKLLDISLQKTKDNVSIIVYHH